jgi:hypothetical protein
MTQLPPEDQQWQEFLRKYRPTPPPAADDLEEQLMSAISADSFNVATRSEKADAALARSQSPVRGIKSSAFASAIAAGLLMAWSGYRFLIPVSESSNSASLEAFLENNWNEVVEEVPASPNISTAQADWMLEVSMAH